MDIKLQIFMWIPLTLQTAVAIRISMIVENLIVTQIHVDFKGCANAGAYTDS